MIRHRLFGAIALLTLLSCSRPDITEANLLANEQWWPYRVQLLEAVPVPGRSELLPARLVGVLIRVEASGTPRIDFGSIGKFEIPPEKTDIADRANEIRLGKAEKEAPNFTYAIRSRMLDSASDRLGPLPIEQVDPQRAFLCVFADPSSAEFEALAKSLAPQDGRGVMTILFPQGTQTDEAIFERLRALEWKVPFLYDFLSEPYTRTLLVEGTAFPYVMLQTAEGRVLLQGAWNPELVAQLGAELERSFASESGSVSPTEDAWAGSHASSRSRESQGS